MLETSQLLMYGGLLLLGWFARHKGFFSGAKPTGRPLLDALLNSLHDTVEGVVQDALKRISEGVIQSAPSGPLPAASPEGFVAAQVNPLLRKP